MYILLQTIRHNGKPHLYLGIDLASAYNKRKKLPKGWRGWAVLKSDTGRVFGISDKAFSRTTCYKDKNGNPIVGKHAQHMCVWGVVDSNEIKDILPDKDILKKASNK